MECWGWRARLWRAERLLSARYVFGAAFRDFHYSNILAFQYSSSPLGLFLETAGPFTRLSSSDEAKETVLVLFENTVILQKFAE